MKLVKQKTCLNIENHDTRKESYKKHGTLFPATIRCIIVGPSNCGKTNVLISLIEHENGLKFENLYVYSKSLYQPKYMYLKELVEPIKGIGFQAYNDNENIVHPSDAKPNSLFIFDDVACDKQEIIREYFSMGRHNAIDMFYLNQTYAKIPKHLIRDNTNALILFKQDDLNLKHIYSDHLSSDMSFEIFKSICAECWRHSYGFLSIFKDEKIDKGRYRKGLDHYIFLE